MNHSKLYRACNPARPRSKPIWPKVVLGGIAFLVFLGYLTERDIAHHAEIAKQMECAPEIEMTMPIEGVRT